MLYQPDLIVFIWLIPALIFFIVPILILPLIRMKKRRAASEKKDAVYQVYAPTGSIDKRSLA
ncbi:MAG: hypothetical protein SCH71_11990 [Desulfobulbaceae bacterium]|nr:hypothetical protein [Desulfobulbaceae bacterium]